MIDEWLSFGAAALTTASFLPQAWMTFRTRDASGISLAMYGAFTLGIALWLAYGIRIGAWPLIVANAGARRRRARDEDPYRTPAAPQSAGLEGLAPGAARSEAAQLAMALRTELQRVCPEPCGGGRTWLQRIGRAR